MIYGKTYEQHRAEVDAANARRQMWRPHFAWLPVRLETGRMAWLEKVETRDYQGIYNWQREYRLPKPEL